MSEKELRCLNWLKLIRPKKVESKINKSYGKFVYEPLEKGYGLTIGNALRRVILSSIYSAAIVSVKFDDVRHEFTTIPGVIEDVSEIILNLKEVRVKMVDVEPKVIRVESVNETIVTAGDIINDDGMVEILNPEQHIATLNKDSKLRMTMTVKVDRGYSLSEENKEDDSPLGTIPIDAVFSPIKRVNYVVGNARVGQKTDYDKLTLEVWTDGSIMPEDAVAYAAKIIKEHMSVFINFDEPIEYSEKKEFGEEQHPKVNENLYRSVDELELSVRSANCLKGANITKIYQLVEKTESQMLKTKNFGRKSLNEIKGILDEMGLRLGMDLEGFECNDDNIEKGA